MTSGTPIRMNLRTSVHRSVLASITEVEPGSPLGVIVIPAKRSIEAGQ
jgi:hypothetical protein